MVVAHCLSGCIGNASNSLVPLTDFFLKTPDLNYIRRKVKNKSKD